VSVSITVNLAPVTVGLSSSSNSIPAGSPITLTATAQSTPAGLSTGTVTFLNGTNVLGTASLVSGVATYSTSLLTLGINTLTASYPGNLDYLAGTSNAVSVDVLPALTATVLSTSLNPAPFATTVTFSAAVSSLAGTPSGTVSFYDGSTLIGTGTLATGIAQFPTSALSVGSHDITAVYGGTAVFAASTSNLITEQIADFSISASPGSRTLYTGEATTYTVTVTPASGFNLPVALTCSQLPANTTCSFSPATITGGPGISTLVVQTSAPGQAATASALSPGYRVVALAGIILLFIPRRMRRYRKGWHIFLLAMSLLTACVAFSACSQPGPLFGGTPIGAQTITVSATATNGSQSLNHQTTVTLNVNSLF